MSICEGSGGSKDYYFNKKKKEKTTTETLDKLVKEFWIIMEEKTKEDNIKKQKDLIKEAFIEGFFTGIKNFSTTDKTIKDLWKESSFYKDNIND